MKNINIRNSEYDINDLFLKRSSPRAMSGEAITKDEMMTLFEAARWAPSAGNNQPWRFAYALGGTPDFDLFFSFLNEGNQPWCKNAGAFVVVLSKTTHGEENKPNPTNSFDAGSAWENLALQGAEMGLVVHGMAGYNAVAVRTELNIADEYAIEVMIAIGRPGKIEDLPEKYQGREAPSQRKNLDEIVFEGKDGLNALKD